MVTKQDIFGISTAKDFETTALEIFKWQFENNPVYRSFCDLLYKHPSDIKSISQIPFLPIQFFQTHRILSATDKIHTTFRSSGTTGDLISKHHVTDISTYEESYLKCFQNFYGAIEDFAILGLLPSYLEREGSSLIYMVNDFIKRSKHPKSGFYLDNFQDLAITLKALEQQQQRTVLIGVSFALLDFIEQYRFNLKHTIIMETGGMKGRRKEIIRAELHKLLRQSFGIKTVHSEYGMTELMSQAYSKGNGIFECPPWMKVLIRDPEDALALKPPQSSGGINIIDLANIDSCAFIATQDLGKVYSNGHFEIIGRFDHSDIRGCNLMVL